MATTVSVGDDGAALTFREHGAERHEGAAECELPAIIAALAHLDRDQGGIRLSRMAGLWPFLDNDGCIGAIAAAVLGPTSRPLRAVLFDKTAETNWSLAWHQDRTICVRERIAVDGYGPWTVKSGMIHVAPPFDLLARMATVRVHLDDVPTTNAPLLVAPGSHTEGRIAVDAVDAVVRRCGVRTCLASAGDVWLYATPILHASEAAAIPQRRRVLQVDYAAEDLPGGLAWLGV